jgi:hypothetical protein
VPGVKPPSPDGRTDEGVSAAVQSDDGADGSLSCRLEVGSLMVPAES